MIFLFLNLFCINDGIFFSELHGEDCQYNYIISNLFLNCDCSICVRVVVSQCCIRASCTTGIQAGSIVLHVKSSDAVFEGFIELAQSSNDKINEVVDIGIGLFLDVDGIDFSFRLILSDSEKVIDGIFEYFDNLF